MKKVQYICLLLLLNVATLIAQNNTVCEMNLQVSMSAAGPINRTITVRGNSSCSHFCISVSADNPSAFSLKKQGVVTDGSFLSSVEIPKNVCGKINVQVRCGSGLQTVCNQFTCSDQRSLFLPCTPSSFCPKILVYSASPVKQCHQIQNGKEEIFFSATVNNPDNVQLYIWNFGDGSQASTSVPFVSHVYECPRASPPYETMLTILCKSNPGILDFKPLQIALRSCNCPVAAGDQILFTPDPKNKCGGTFEIQLTGACRNSATQLVLDFGDNSIPMRMAMPADGKIKVNHLYECGSNAYEASLRFEGLSGEVGLCELNKKIKLEDCRPCLAEQPNEVEIIDPENPGNPGTSPGDDDCFSCRFCGGEWWCCLLFGLFVLFLTTTALLLMRALCPGSTGYDWLAFAISLAALIAAAVIWAVLCEVNLCMLFGGTAFASWTGWSLICDSNLVPCNTWLCGMATIPGTGVQVTRLWIARILLTILAVIACAAGW